ncbi:MAG: CAP domain-containing protein [Flavobacteriales bacterium]
MRIGILGILILTYCGMICSSFQLPDVLPFPKQTNTWDSSLLAKAFVAAHEYDTSMTDTERDVIYYCNLARLDPKKFADTYVTDYIKTNVKKETSYTRSLVRDLKKARPMYVLQGSQDLYQCAYDHAVKSGKKGTTGHQELVKRMKKFAPARNPYGENCDYGNDNALDIVMSWLIDEGVSDLSHRKNMLDKEYTSAGVSIQPHKKMRVNAVMDFGR